MVETKYDAVPDIEDDEQIPLTDEEKAEQVAKLDRQFVTKGDDTKVSRRAEYVLGLRAELRNLRRRPDDDSVHGKSKGRRIAEVEAELDLYGDTPEARGEGSAKAKGGAARGKAETGESA